MIQEITKNSQIDLCAVTISGNGVGSGASTQEGSTLRAISPTLLRACPKKYKKIVLNIFEQTRIHYI
jgi:hypothetical protein